MAIIKVGDKATAPSVRPSLLLDFANSKTMDPRMTFTRSSTGTYYDNNTQVKGSENIYPDSDTLWNTGGGTVSHNSAVAPDGTITATTLTESSDLSYRDGGITVGGQQGHTTVSIHVKMFGTSTRFPFLGVRNSFSNWGGIIANTTNNTVTTIDTGNVDIIDGGIFNLGNGWYRIWATIYQTATNNINVRFGYGDSATTVSSNAYFADYYTGDGASGCYVWGPQVESRDYVTAYTPTNGSRIINYIPALVTAEANKPRFDHDPVTRESKGLLLETSSATNLYTGSSSLPGARFNQAYNISNYSTAPDGSKTARLYIQAGGSSGYSYTSFSNVIGNNTYVVSCFLKKAYGVGSMVFGIAGAAGILRTGFNVDSQGSTWQSSDNSNLSEIEYGHQEIGDGWYRVWIKGKTDNSPGYQEIQFDPQTNNGAWLAWGLQIETGKSITSYIPTSGSAVTRAGESAYVVIDDDSKWYAKGKGSLYVEGAINVFVTSQGLAGFRDETDSGATWNGIYGSPNGQVICSNYSAKYGGSQGGNVSSSAGLVSEGDFVRAAMSFSYDYGAGAMSTGDTVHYSSERSNMLIPTHTRFYVGRLGSGYSILNGHIKKVAYYPEALDVSELEALVEE